ncbi:MAG: cell division protein ZapA [Coxiellaceae bacterium]|nr:cell division protein ZapA [Coxiellaceae bacterium]|tara:strand:- start:749 stop:1066 length:318 start_codon:yes stop_codon:yes gene_type:complete
MTTVTENLISIQILDRKYSIKCPTSEVLELQEAARVVQDNMKQLKRSGSISTTDQLAVVSALNVTHELLLLKKQNNNYINVMNKRLQDLQKRIEKFLAVEEEITI